MILTHTETGLKYEAAFYWLCPVQANWGRGQWEPAGHAVCDKGEVFTLHKLHDEYRAIGSHGMFRPVVPYDPARRALSRDAVAALERVERQNETVRRLEKQLSPITWNKFDVETQN